MKKVILISITLLFLFPLFGNAQWYTGISFDTPIQFKNNQLDLGKGGTYFIRYDFGKNIITQYEHGFYKREGEQSSLAITTVAKLGYNFQLKRRKARLSFPSYLHLGTYRNKGKGLLYWGISTNLFYHINNKFAVFGGVQQSFSIKINGNQSYNFSSFSTGIAINLVRE